MILDFSIPFQDRVEAFTEISDVGDAVSSLMFIYTMSASVDAGNFLLWISKNDAVDFSIRLECAITLVENANKFSDMSVDAYDSIDALCGTNHPFLLCQRAVLYLMSSKKHRFRSRKHMLSLIQRADTEMRLKYAMILAVSNAGLSEKSTRYFTVAGLDHVVSGQYDMMYRLMAAQNILTATSGVTSKMYETCASNAVLFVVDTAFTHHDYNTRADAADILLASKDPGLVSIGRETIDELAGGTGTYFTNNQNVHIKSIEESCVSNLERLMKHTRVVKDLDASLKEFLGSFENTESISRAIERIVADRATYTSLRLTLASIFCRVWAYVRVSNSRDTLLTRLYEELEDSVGVCSSGFMARIVNTLSGFDGFNVGISFEDQVSAYWSTTVSRLIAESAVVDDILDDMSSGDGKAVRAFVVDNLSRVREDMHKEFRDHISDTDFDVYFKKAFTAYFGA